MGFTEEDNAVAAELLRPNSHSSAIVIAPRTTWESRCWPVSRYTDRINRLHRKGLLLIGGRGDRDSLEEIAGRCKIRPVVLDGVLTFRQMAALIARANVLVGSDSAPMHVSAAVGTPFVALFGPTPFRERAPLSGTGIVLQHSVPCGPCDRAICLNKENPLLCMQLITVDEVLARVEASL